MMMKTQITLAAMLSAALFSATLAAEPTFGTGGYSRQLHTLEQMKMLDADGDHMVSRAEYTGYYGSLFEALDANRDGTVDATEWVGTKGKRSVSIATGGYTTALRNKKMMDMMDGDGDHKITRDEFIRFHEPIFTSMDAKGDGMIDAQNWLRRQTGN
jgi:hypothetical protein